jgi:hypothetical protein
MIDLDVISLKIDEASQAASDERRRAAVLRRDSDWSISGAVGRLDRSVGKGPLTIDPKSIAGHQRRVRRRPTIERAGIARTGCAVVGRAIALEWARVRRAQIFIGGIDGRTEKHQRETTAAENRSGAGTMN